ncbi:unnamed protein product [Fusarium venenatum]|uniref:Uncharacterized protein n=1 Tax=Fusarium venenatum TaxID=56646 RepID=A0A2L2SUJ6_9HYPO|nr:uncharacterized protein FVRRES_05578 [Fusarium venenatum]CEI61142.1 unnamed protein product [Fusarium venenatum]
MFSVLLFQSFAAPEREQERLGLGQTVALELRGVRTVMESSLCEEGWLVGTCIFGGGQRTTSKGPQMGKVRPEWGHSANQNIRVAQKVQYYFDSTAPARTVICFAAFFNESTSP